MFNNYGDDEQDNVVMFEDVVFGDDGFLCSSPPAENPFGVNLKLSMFFRSNDDTKRSRLVHISFVKLTSIDKYV